MKRFIKSIRDEKFVLVEQKDQTKTTGGTRKETGRVGLPLSGHGPYTFSAGEGSTNVRART
jgi:hypothetical protein